MKIFRFRDVLPQLPNILFRHRLRFTFELLPFEAKELRLKKIGNFFLAGLNQFLLPAKPMGYPVVAQVEPANFCNLSCPLCLTTLNKGSRPRMLLTFKAFKHFIDEVGDYLLLIVLWSNGEPFLNPDIFKIIEYAKSKNILVHTSTNGNVKFDDEKSTLLVESGLDSLVVAVDGATQKTYSTYRKGGDLDLVFSNIKKIIRTKREMGSSTPLVNLRFIVMKHNEEEVPLIKQVAEKLQVDFLTFRTVVSAREFRADLVHTFSPESSRYCGYEGESQDSQKRFICMRPWKRITLSAGGNIISCEFDHKDLYSFGNIENGLSIKSIWKGNNSIDFRKMFNLGSNDLYHCEECCYKNMVVDDCTVEKVHLRPVQQGSY